MRAEACDQAPDDWTIRPIGSVCTRVTSGGTPSRKKPAFYEGGVWGWVKTQELQDSWIEQTDERITDEAIRASSAKVLPPNTILLALYGATVGQLGLLRTAMTCNQACCAMIVDECSADFRYLYYQLLLHRNQLKQLATGAAQQNLSGALIKSFELPFPKLTEQRAIAATLGALDDKIEQNRRTSRALEELARATFKAWFVDFEPVKAKAAGQTSFPGMPAAAFTVLPDRLTNSLIGTVPEGWEIRPIGDVVTVKGGGTPSTKVADYWEGGAHFWATPKDLSGLQDPVLLGTERRITDAGVECISSGVMPDDTVLLSSRAPVGYTAIAKMPIAVNQGFIALVCDGPLSPLFVLHWLRSSLEEIKSRSSGTTFPEISKASFRPIPLAVPSPELVRAFDAATHPLFELITSNVRESAKLAGLRDYLLPRLLGGKVRVSV